jgi:hypothetical protein
MMRAANRSAVRGLALSILLAAPLRAQDPAVPAAPAPPAPTPTPTPAPTPTPTPRPARRVAAPTLAAGVGGPLLVSGSAGLILGSDRAAPDECPSPRGVLAQAEAGVGGIKVGAGPVFTYCHTPLGSLGAGALQATYLRTWGNPLGTDPDLDYAGGELRVGLIDWRLTLGLLKRVNGDQGANWLFTWGIARGF